MGKSDIANSYADMIIKKKMSIRDVARYYSISKTHVHNYISRYTTGYLRKLFLRRQLRMNSMEFWKKGGSATKLRWENLKKSKNLDITGR